MIDEEIQEAHRQWTSTGDPAYKEQWLALLRRVGVVWLLKYGRQAVGLDNSTIGLFYTRDAAVEHLKKHHPKVFPGLLWNNNLHRTQHEKEGQEQGRWVGNGHRNIVLTPVLIHETPQDEWFCYRAT